MAERVWGFSNAELEVAEMRTKPRTQMSEHNTDRTSSPDRTESGRDEHPKTRTWVALDAWDSCIKRCRVSGWHMSPFPWTRSRYEVRGSWDGRGVRDGREIGIIANSVGWSDGS